MEACSRTDSGKFSPRRRRGTIELALAAVLLIALPGGQAATAQQIPDSAIPASVQADARARLEAFNADVRSLTASFTQETWTADNELVDEAYGSFALLRPGRFVWHTQSPFEHLVVADGSAIWMYDIDLEQATRTGIDDLSGANPGSLLSGDRAVDEDYRIVTSYRLEDRELIELVPRDPRADYSRILVAFRGSAPVSLEIVDGLNQTTSIEFSDIEINPDIGPERFVFEVPDGVDVIGDER